MSTPPETIKLDEQSLRKPSFKADVAIQLCDSQLWYFPRPVLEFAVGFGDDGSVKMVPDGTSFGQAYGDLYDAFMNATAGSDQVNAGAALAVDLLRRNYSLEPSQLSRLLRYRSNDAENAAMWQAIVNVAIGNEGPKDEPGDDT